MGRELKATTIFRYSINIKLSCDLCMSLVVPLSITFPTAMLDD